jgi:hypothetical protein
MFFEYIRYRVQLDRDQNCLELAQLAALMSLRNSTCCQSWSVLPAPDSACSWILKIEWDPGVSLTPFRGSREFTELEAALIRQVRALEETDYRTDADSLRLMLGGSEALVGVAEGIVSGLMHEPLLGWRFESEDGSRRARLVLWLLAVLGGPDLFSSSFPDARLCDGPLADELLDLEERARLLEVARASLQVSREEQGRCVMGILRAHLPLYPEPPLKCGVGAYRLEADAVDVEDLPPTDGPTPHVDSGDAPRSHQVAVYAVVKHA